MIWLDQNLQKLTTKEKQKNRFALKLWKNSKGPKRPETKIVIGY